MIGEVYAKSRNFRCWSLRTVDCGSWRFSLWSLTEFGFSVGIRNSTSAQSPVAVCGLALDVEEDHLVDSWAGLNLCRLRWETLRDWVSTWCPDCVVGNAVLACSDPQVDGRLLSLGIEASASCSVGCIDCTTAVGFEVPWLVLLCTDVLRVKFGECRGRLRPMKCAETWTRNSILKSWSRALL